MEREEHSVMVWLWVSGGVYLVILLFGWALCVAASDKRKEN